MIFRPIRTLILLTFSFAAGVVYEKQQQAERCIRKADLLADIVCTTRKNG